MSFSTRDPERKHLAILDSELAYVEIAGLSDGPTVVLLHGNPTSAYLWRNVMAELEGDARCLAPDLVGMGHSKPSPAGRYRFVDHRRYLDAWFEAVLPAGDLAGDPAGDVVLVVHDWGSALGFDWAKRHPERVVGIVYMEAIVRPIASWEEWPEAARSIFQALRSGAGEEMALQKNVFVERILPASVIRKLGEEEMAIYRAPYLEPGESRRPTLTWPREIPIAGEPPDVVAIVDDYSRWLATTEDLPKLFVNADPGTILTGAQREHCRSWPNQTEVTVRGLHFIQEDSPREIGQAITGFLERL